MVASAIEPACLMEAAQAQAVAQAQAEATSMPVTAAQTAEAATQTAMEVARAEPVPAAEAAAAPVPAAEVAVAAEEMRTWMAELERRVEAALWPAVGVRAQHIGMLLQARRSGGRQRRRRRQRMRASCWQPDVEPSSPAFVGEEEATRRFMAAAQAHGMLAGA